MVLSQTPLRRKKPLALAVISALLFVAGALASPAQSATTELVSPAGGLDGLAISADGNVVAFRNALSVWTFDRTTGALEPASISTAGQIVQSSNFALSGDGRFVVFQTRASSLDPFVAGAFRWYRRDRQERQTHPLIPGGTPSLSQSSRSEPAISRDGRYFVGEEGSNLRFYDAQVGTSTLVAAFAGSAGISSDGRYVTYIVDAGGAKNVVRWDRATDERDVIATDATDRGWPAVSDISDNGAIVLYSKRTLIGSQVFRVTNSTTQTVDTGNLGEPADGPTSGASMSADGRFVAYSSRATNLISDDTNERTDAFLYDANSGRTERISLTSAGLQIEGGIPSIGKPALSDDATAIAFNSSSDFVVPDDADGLQDVFVRVRTTSPASGYVAIGDSYSSGVGALDYNPLTRWTLPLNVMPPGFTNCWRSRDAYPHLLTDGRVSALPQTLGFYACQGATTQTLREGSADEGTEPPQLTRITLGTQLVTLGIGGNDLGFAPRLVNCLVGSLSLPAPCYRSEDRFITEAMDSLVDDSIGLSRLQQLFVDAKRRAAPSVRVLGLGYARFFPYYGGGSFRPGLATTCEGLRLADQLWINEWIETLNREVKYAARSTGSEYVDLLEASSSHELCANNSDDPYLHGLRGVPTRDGDRIESFHPTAFGHVRIAEAVRATLATSPPAPLLIRPGETITTTFTVPVGAPSTTAATRWPGSDVVLALTSPSGRSIGRSTAPASDVSHNVGPTSESYVLRSPEAGVWTATLYGADVPPAGERVQFVATSREAVNRRPTASVGQQVDGWHVQVSGTGSLDPDGQVVDYLWDFGDGTTKVGPEAEHTYSTAGTYRIALVVRDDQGALGFGSADVDIVANPDTTSPTIALSQPGSGEVYARGAATQAAYSCSDNAGGSGVASCTGTTPSGGFIDTGALGEKTFSVTATDHAGNTAATTHTYTVVDLTPPSVSLISPSDGQSVTLGQILEAEYTCADDTGGSGIASCTGPVATGTPMNTSVVGFQTFNVTATDAAGNSTTVSTTYQVIYPFNGFFEPVNSLPTINTVNAGRGIPVRFSLGGDRGLDILASGSPSSVLISCDSGAPLDEIEEALTSGSSGLTYDASSNTYSYVWKTQTSWAGTCRELRLTLADGTTRSARFKFR